MTKEKIKTFVIVVETILVCLLLGALKIVGGLR